MKSAPLDQLNVLSKKTKRQRMLSHNHKRLSEYEMRRELENVIEVSSKSNDIIELLKNKILNIHEKEKEKVEKKSHHFFKEQVIRKIEDLNAGFFNPKIEVTCFNRKIDRVLQQAQSKLHLKSMMDITADEQSITRTAPQSPKRPVKLNKIKQESNQTNLSRKCSTLPAKSIDEGRKTNALFNESPRLFKRQSSKKSNTFLFNIPTRKIPKKSAMKCELKYDWQLQLLQNVNIIQKTNIKSKNNMKVDRQKLSSFLKERYLNEVITSYFKFEPIENFNFVKNTIDELIRMGEKEIKMVTFFTYDYNQDGFICEQDIYRFLEFLPFDSKILADINMIIEFLRKNKLRSLETNLPNNLLKKRQKTVFDALANQQSSFSKVEIKKKKNLAQRMFSISKKNDELPILKPLERSVFKKFQINFDVFCLIFAEKIPILIFEIIKSLTQKIGPPEIIPVSEIPTATFNHFLETRNKDWITRMNKSKELVVQARNQQQILSQKID